jgi:hypothetical protein
VHVIASRSHYAAHLAPIVALLPPGQGDDTALVASYADLCRARRLRYRRIVLAQHGAGQSYSNDHPCYPGGRDNGDVGLFLVPNEHAAGRWRRAYPRARVEVVGSPRLDVIPPRSRVGRTTSTLAISTHWPGSHEAGSAWPWMMAALPALADRYELLVHSHPKRSDVARQAKRMGLEFVPDFDDVCRRADLLIHDNSSTLYEFASTGRPVVVVDAPTYRRDVHHGLRFWDAADVGVRMAAPGDMVEAVALALADPPDVVSARESALDLVYAFRTGAARRAADAIMGYAARQI